jgi:hypothetical protein
VFAFVTTLAILDNVAFRSFVSRLQGRLAVMAAAHPALQRQ